MWSDKYFYLNIYKDKNLSSNWDTRELRAYINGIPELRQANKYEFENIEAFPFTQLLLMNANSLDTWTDSDNHPQKTNLITIVCGKGELVDFNKLKNVFIQIASFLQWKLVDEETDDGLEHYTIWEPNKND